MTDRQSLLDAIRANFHEDTPRLMYADWLDEFGTTDLDRATSEFIKVSCENRKGISNRMPHGAYKWLKGSVERGEKSIRNPFRLIPTLLLKEHRRAWELWQQNRDALHLKATSTSVDYFAISSDQVLCEVVGRGLWARINVWNESWTPRSRLRPYYTCTCAFYFWKGFCFWLKMYTPYGQSRLMPLLLKDQPLVLNDPEVTGMDAPKIEDIK